MRAVVLEDKATMNGREVPRPEVSPGHALLQVKAVSICGSDISRYVKGHRTYPMILGHEMVGTIAQIGDAALPSEPMSSVPWMPAPS